jgi:hypothetical protein
MTKVKLCYFTCYNPLMFTEDYTKVEIVLFSHMLQSFDVQGKKIQIADRDSTEKITLKLK